MLTLTQQDETRLATAANAAMSQALSASNRVPGGQHGWLPGAPTSEPEAVAAVVSVGCPDTALGWKPILNPLGYQVQIIGVFCHQKPYVNFTDGSGQAQLRELADLLLVVDDMHTNDRRALLVQTKLINGATYRLTSPGDLAQFDLYANWPLFNFRAKSLRRPISFDLHSPLAPGMASESGSYGGIDILPHPVGWEQLTPSRRLIPGSGHQLGRALARMVTGAAGRAAVIGGADDWSECVDALLIHTYQAAARGFTGSPQRGITSIAFMAGTAEFGGIGLRISSPPPGEVDDGDAFEGEGPGSLIHVRLTHFDPTD